MKVRGTGKPELSAHSCGLGSQPPQMTQLSAAPPCSPPTPPHRGGQARSGRAGTVCQRPWQEYPSPEDSSGQVAPVPGIDQGPLPSLCLSRIAFLRTGQDKAGEQCQLPLGFQRAMERKCSGPRGQGWDLPFIEKIPSAEPAGELYRCAVQAGSQPAPPPWPSPEDKGSEGDSRAS